MLEILMHLQQQKYSILNTVFYSQISVYGSGHTSDDEWRLTLQV